MDELEQRGRRFGPSGTAPTFPLLGVQLGGTVAAALRRAAVRIRPGEALGTGPLLAALDESDGGGSWDRFWLLLGEGDSTRIARLDDPHERPQLPAPDDARWDGVPLTPALSASLSLLREMADTYGLQPVPPGALALALLCEPTSAVVSSLVHAGHRSQAQLFELAQDELLGSSLTGFAEWVALRLTGSVQNGTTGDVLLRARAAAAAENRQADDVDLLDGLVAGLEAAAPGRHPALPILHLLLPDAAGPARQHGTRPLDDTLRAIAAPPGGDALRLLAELAQAPSPACRAVFASAGLTGPGVAADARRATLDDGGKRLARTPLLTAVTLADGLLMIVVCGLVVIHALGPGHWWELVMLYFLGKGAPTESLTVPVLLVPALFILTNPLLAGLQVVRCGLDALQTRLELRRIRAVSGVRLTAPEYAKHLRRTLRPKVELNRAKALARWRLARLEQEAAA